MSNVIEEVLEGETAESQEFSFTGTAQIAIWGNGSVCLLKKVGDSPWLPLTDPSGNVIMFENDEADGVILNTDISNSSRAVKFKIQATDAVNVTCMVQWGW